MTNHAYLDRLTALFLIASCGGLSADHGQKRELGGVTITGGLDLIGSARLQAWFEISLVFPDPGGAER